MNETEFQQRDRQARRHRGLAEIDRLNAALYQRLSAFGQAERRLLSADLHDACAAAYEAELRGAPAELRFVG